MIRVLVPVLNRPRNVPRFLSSLADNDAGVPVTATFIVSPGDRVEVRALNKTDADYIVVPFMPGAGDWARKINHAVGLYDDEWFLLGADDLGFHEGWGTAALACAAAAKALVVGTNDLGNMEAHRHRNFSTHPLVHRSYVQRGVLDRPGVLLNDNYDHNYPDRELAETARYNGVWVYCDDAIVEHLHPSWGKAPVDTTYRKGAKNFSRDQRMFFRRRRLWRVAANGRLRRRVVR